MEETTLVCPKCGGKILENEKLFQCENAKQKRNEETEKWEEVGKCDWKAWKSTFERFKGPELTEELLGEILENGEVVVELISKTDKPYKKYAVPDDTYGVKIDFNRNINN